MSDRRFETANTAISGLKLVRRLPISDHRGSLTRLYCRETLASAKLDAAIDQINLTVTRARGAIRGMHFQYPPHAEDKLVSCIRGAVFDVAVDLRAGSATFLHWHGELLSADNGVALLIPKGFAHGFQTVTEDCQLLYLHTASYAREAEDGLNPFDPDLAIEWPLPVSDISARDHGHPLLADKDFAGIRL